MAALKGGLMMNLGPILSDSGVAHWATWTNPEATPIQVKSLTVTMGLDKGGVADYQSIVQTPDNTWLILTGWDRYVDPAGCISRTVSYGDDWVAVPIGGQLWLNVICKGYSTPLPNFQVVVNGLYSVSS